MPDLPEAAVTAAEDADRCAHTSGVPEREIARIVAVAAVEAAEPAIAAHVRRQDEEERERTLVLDQDLAEEAEDNHGAPDLVERMAYAIPVRLVKSEAVGIGAARRECIARAVLPVVENELERARADERCKIAAEREVAGLVVVSAEDLHVYVVEEMPDFVTYVTAQARLRAALPERRTETS